MLLILTAVLGACATGGSNPDPHEGLNRFFFGFNEVLDSMIGEPLAELYNGIFPEFVREGLHNAFDNVAYLNVILNQFLQGKVDDGLSDLARMAINSTLGIAGIFDVATGMGFERHEEDFGQTLAVWGVEQQPYLVLPLLGPTTGRDAWSIPVAVATNPLFYLNFRTALFVVGGFKIVDERARVEGQLKQRDELALDPYVFTREAFLGRREYLVNDGQMPEEFDEDLYEDFEEEELYQE